MGIEGLSVVDRRSLAVVRVAPPLGQQHADRVAGQNVERATPQVDVGVRDRIDRRAGEERSDACAARHLCANLHFGDQRDLIVHVVAKAVLYLRPDSLDLIRVLYLDLEHAHLAWFVKSGLGIGQGHLSTWPDRVIEWLRYLYPQGKKW